MQSSCRALRLGRQWLALAAAFRTALLAFGILMETFTVIALGVRSAWLVV
jgi:hypothetical protein